MNKKENGFSLVIVVVFMSIAALFIGYLMGSWLISFLVEDNDKEITQKNSTTVSQNKLPENIKKNESSNNSSEKEINKTNSTAPPAENTTNTTELPKENDSSNLQSTQDNKTQEPKTQNNGQSAAAGNFGVQVGAFGNYSNALTIKNEVEALGYQVLITDDSPHKVQVVGYYSREEAETAVEKLETDGYNGFIVARE